jgi:hypothetical protein
MPAYPFYLVAACWAAGEAVRLAVESRDRDRLWGLVRLALPRVAAAFRFWLARVTPK